MKFQDRGRQIMKALFLLFAFNCVLASKPLQKLKDTGRPQAHYESLIQGQSVAVPDALSRNNSPHSRRSKFGDMKASIPRYIDITDKKGEIKENKEDITVKSDVSGFKRAGPLAALLSNEKVQEAAIDKGIDIAGKLVDKQMQIVDDAQKKASDFLANEIKLDITPDKGWQNEDMFLPSGYHIDASVSGTESPPKDVGAIPYLFPAGMGAALMNGCWGKGYQPGDPCYAAKWTSDVCQNMIDGADFIGVGFDGRGSYSPESRKMSLAQRNCAGKGTYDGLDVPDTMNVHGVYDTSARIMTYESREEYQKQLQQEAGVSGSYFGFSAGVKQAWGESKATARQKYMAVLDIDIERYEIFMDEVKPEHLSMSFLREFMDLPTSYFSAGGPLKYQNFIQRWGTHYVKSAKFGGRLEIRKTMDAEDVKSKKEFEVQMEMEYKSLFSSVSAKASYKESESSRQQTKTTSTSVVAQGGSQEIASILSDVYSPSFKTEFKEWLKTVPKYAKAFRFQMGSITDFLNFKATDLFKEETVNWGCEGNSALLQTEKKDDKTLNYYEVTGAEGNKTRYYCEFDSRQAVEDAIQRRRTSLKRAIEIYMEEGTFSISDIQLEKCKRQNDEPYDDKPQNPFRGLSTNDKPLWSSITKQNNAFRVSFDLLDDLPNAFRKAFNLEHNTSRLVRFYDNRWYTSDRDGSFHLYGGFNNGKSDNTAHKKVSILGLVLTFNEADGTLVLSKSDFEESQKYFPTLTEDMKEAKLARLEIPYAKPVKRSNTAKQPCQVKWSNALRFDPTDAKGKCLHFTASAAGSIFVVFAALPKDSSSRYYVEISPDKVAIYKGTSLKTSTTNINARALGDASLYQSYFVCITESDRSTLVEYGKSLGTSDSGDIYLNLIDNAGHLNARFYAFGNDENPAMVMDSHIVSRQLTKAECKGDTVKDLETNLCIQKCHEDCDPLAGCKSSESPKIGEGCNACRVALDVENNKCIPECPGNKTLREDKKCLPTFDAKAQVPFGHTPSLPMFTMCHWLKLSFVGTWNNWRTRRFQVSLENWVNHVWSFLEVHDNQIMFYSLIRPLMEQDVVPIKRITVNQLRDFKWHQFCVTWSGFSGVVHIYFDGKKMLSAANQPRGEIPGGLTLRVGNDQHLVSEFNLWDRVLSEKEIERNANSCDGGKGNAMQWHQAFSYLKGSKSKYFFPSSCEARSRNDEKT